MASRVFLNIWSSCQRAITLLKGDGVIFELLRFGIIGVLATATHYGIYLLAMGLIGINIAYTIGYALSFIVNYYLSAIFTFKSKASIKSGLGFLLSHMINYGVHFGLLNLFIEMRLAPTLAPIPVFLIAIPLNFILVRFVFTSKLLK